MNKLADIDMPYVSSLKGIPTEEVKDYVKNVLQFWRDKFEVGLLSSVDFEDLWKCWVPKLYILAVNEDRLNWSFSGKLVQDVLFKTLDDFICNGDSSIVFKQLSKIGGAPSVCCRPFKDGEPTYFCKECAVHKICFLCVECFKNSEHRYHKYKMCTSGGLGGCDCGNTEIWKRHPFCEIHMNDRMEQEETINLPEDFIERTKIVFEAVLWYIYRSMDIGEKSNLEYYDVCTVDLFDTDSFCTTIYNQKSHTFPQIIKTLTTALKCNKRRSTGYLTHLVREGRAIVKCSTFQYCSELKSKIEKHSSSRGRKPVKVLVNHTYAVAHQIFAQKLLFWLEEYLETGRSLRKIFADAILKTNDEEACICEGFLLCDSFLWESIRNQWHKLLKSGILLEYENKKEFAKVFARNYGHIMRNFIEGDQEHTHSVSALSIQLFTVPSIAHHLIAYEDVIYILLDVLISECRSICNTAGKLDFGRIPATRNFKRALYVLYDLRYLLSVIPEQWNDDLRKGFLRGIYLMLQLFTMMQDMDAVIGQEVHHIEYEPEWKSGFILQFKLSDSLSLALKWCYSDKVVLIQSVRSVLETIKKNNCDKSPKPGEANELFSVHLPLTRFLAALYLSLEKFNLTFDAPELLVAELTPVQIIKPILRIHLVKAQVQQGMWRRNGDTLLKTLFFYHNVNYRNEMLDRDITLLQAVAAQMESNEFLTHILHKFDIFHWTMSKFDIKILTAFDEDKLKQINSLVEEFLHLLIIIIGERWMTGVSHVTIKDRIRKEIVQHLSIKPLPHSELVRTMSDDLTSRELTADRVIEQVTIFKKHAHITGTSVHELKEQYYEEFNVFFYHYTREESSKAEEAQRKRTKAKEELECCPPPKLPKLTKSFATLVNLLQCDVMLHIMGTVLERCSDLKATTYSESQLHMVLYLIGYALQEEETKNYPFFKFIENAKKFNLLHLIELLSESPRFDFHKDLIKWTLIKYIQLANDKKENYTILKKECISRKVDNEKQYQTKLAAERRVKLLEQMERLQNNFIKNNPDLFMEASEKAKTSSTVEIQDVKEIFNPIALGPNQTTKLIKEKTCICIICKEEEKVTAEGPILVLAAFVQKTTILCPQKTNVTDIPEHDLPCLHANLGPAPYVSTCGHVMHFECWKKYYSIMEIEYRRLGHPDVKKQEFLCPVCERLSNTVLPLIPSLASLQSKVPKSDLIFEQWIKNIHTVLLRTIKICHGALNCDSTDKNENGTSSNQHLSSVGCESMQQLHQMFHSYEPSFDLPETLVEVRPKESVTLNNSYKESIFMFSQTVCIKGLHAESLPSVRKLGPINWKSLAYTIHTIEVLLRDSNKPLLGQLLSRQKDCIESFTRMVSVLGNTLSISMFMNNYAVNLLSILFKHNNESPSILQWDSLGFLISLTFSLPSLSGRYAPVPIPTGGTLDSYLLRIIFICHIVKILVLLTNDLDNPMETDEKNDAIILEILEIIGKKRENVSTHSIWTHVQNACIPFLRCCVLFYHYLTETPAPVKLTIVGGDTFENMCSYLDLPQNPKDLFNSTDIKELIKPWSNHNEVLSYLRDANLQVIREPQAIPRLLKLPSDYSELINDVFATFTCVGDNNLADPGVCLICGTILCLAESDFHLSKCGNDVGIFLQVRNCQLLLLTDSDKGCFVPAPYVDEYGEVDQGLIRGNRLKLCPERYRQLEILWLSHGIYEQVAKSNNTT